MTQPKIIGDQIDQSTLNVDSILPSQTGNNGKVLGTDGTNASWVTAGGGSGTVTSVDVSGGTTGLTFTGGPVTTSGTITAGGTLDEVNGGTGQTSYATGDILYASASNTLSKLTAGSDGQVLTLASGVPSWAAGGGAGGTSYTLEPVRVATTANITLSNTQTIDGVSVLAGDRVLVKNQSTASQNGVYACVSGGSWTREADFNTGAATLTGGVIVPVTAGTQNGGTTWQCWNNSAITVGSTSVVFGPLNNIMSYGPVGMSSSNIASATGNRSTAIGWGAKATGLQSICIAASSGNTTSSGQQSIMIGTGSGSAGGEQSISIGTGNVDSGGNYSITIGDVAAGASQRKIYIGSTISSGIGNAGLTSNGVAMGFGAHTSSPGEFSVSRGAFSASPQNHIVKSGNWLGWYQTSNATPARLGSVTTSVTTTPTGYFYLDNNTFYSFSYRLIAFRTGPSNITSFSGKGLVIRGNSAANTALVGTPTIAQDFDDSSSLTTSSVSITADTTNGSLNFTVTGIASTNIRWVVDIDFTRTGGTF